ncbi:hypothetical protein PanWU01x14_043900 [Parasponia andersonii]|uniref:Uncharacterized protein n=1 Tax=Parasponia andersonii TaxID=3476 RepID=A0A2P5DP28_PARAD|nr:hypothetical protein PanWU01x14_043900 [Parasponia andersonii]
MVAAVVSGYNGGEGSTFGDNSFRDLGFGGGGCTMKNQIVRIVVLEHVDGEEYGMSTVASQAHRGQASWWLLVHWWIGGLLSVGGKSQEEGKIVI